jgi:hypothetical protein
MPEFIVQVLHEDGWYDWQFFTEERAARDYVRNCCCNRGVRYRICSRQVVEHIVMPSQIGVPLPAKVKRLRKTLAEPTGDAK